MIRKIKAQDYKYIMDIWLKTNTLFHNYIPKEYWEKNYEIVKNIYLPKSETFIYEDNSTIKGFISIIDKNFIGGLFVLKEYQSNGIGNNLLNFAINKYKNLSLTVYTKNQRAINFYKKNGFVIIKEQNSDYEKEMEYLMNKI